MYINSGYLNNSRADFKDNSTPLVVGSCGTYRLKTRPNLPTYWQKGRRDYQILYVANGKTHFWFDGKEEIVSAGHMVRYKPCLLYTSREYIHTGQAFISESEW